MSGIVPLHDLAGYSVLGRHGFLGTVIDADTPGAPARIVFRGGVSDALLFHVPVTHVRRISRRDRTVTLEVDVGDFAPRRSEGGVVELHLTR